MKQPMLHSRRVPSGWYFREDETPVLVGTLPEAIEAARAAGYLIGIEGVRAAGYYVFTQAELDAMGQTIVDKVVPMASAGQLGARIDALAAEVGRPRTRVIERDAAGLIVKVREEPT